MSIHKITLASAAFAVMSTSAFANNLPTDFYALDKDGNGTVTFTEYQAHSQSLGLSTTQAAQDFTRAAQGDALLTAEELSLALAFEDQPYALQSFAAPAEVSSEPLALPVAETVEDSPVMAFEPMTVETPPVEEAPVETEVIIVEPDMKEPEVFDSAPMETRPVETVPTEPEIIEDNLTETPLEDVMGEVETYTPENLTEETITEEALETPTEEGFEDIVEDDPS